MPCPELEFPLIGQPPWEPACVYASLRTEFPVASIRLPTGATARLVTRYADNQVVLSDPRFSRAAAAAPGAPRGRSIPLESRAITTMDPPEHSRLRRLVIPAFTVRSVERLRPRIESITERLLDRIIEGPRIFDLVSAYAQPLALRVICELLGVPEADHGRFRAWTENYLSTSQKPDAIAAASQELFGYISRLVADKSAFPGSGLIDRLIAARDDDALTERELTALGVTLLVAGYQTTANEITNATLALLRHPVELASSRGIDRLAGAPLEELLRYTLIATTGGTLRVALEDVEISGTTIRAGEAVMPAITSANRDPVVFTDPDRLDLARDPNPHLAFGYGPHHCLGAHLARVELEVALGALLRRLPHLTLAGPLQGIEWNFAKTVQGPLALHLSW